MFSCQTNRFVFMFLLLSCSLFFDHIAFATPKNTAVLLTVDGAIGPATDDYIHQGMHLAEHKKANFVIIQLDTPGGLHRSMDQILKRILAAPVPVITYVYPTGARAASAGMYIMYASDIAAMAPGTHIGAATPIHLNGKLDEKNALDKKMLNDALANIKSLAQLHKRDVTFAEKAVTTGASLTADQALEQGVIDIEANNMQDLLQQLNGMQVQKNQQTITLQTKQLSIINFAPSWRARVLGIITDPNIAYILLLIGIYGLLFEFTSPGFMLPGIIGVIAILLSLYALQLLPINYFGLSLILLGLIFLAIEAYLPSFGVLGVAGIIAFIFGSIFLIEPTASGYGVHWLLILIMAVINLAFFFIVIMLAIKARKRRVVTGAEELIGMHGIALTDFEKQQGQIRVHGEIWQAHANTPVKKDMVLKIVKIQDLILLVEPIHHQQKE